MDPQQGDILLYQYEDGEAVLDVSLLVPRALVNVYRSQRCEGRRVTSVPATRYIIHKKHFR